MSAGDAMHIEISPFLAKVYAGVAVLFIASIVYGAIALRDTAQTNTAQISNLTKRVGKVQTDVSGLQAINSKYEFILYRINKLEGIIEANTGRIQKNRDAISRMGQGGDAAFTGPPAQPDDLGGLVSKLILYGWFESPARAGV